MGDEIKWTPDTAYSNWRDLCQGMSFKLPFLGETLWSIGPTPWVMNLVNSNGLFPNGAWGTTDSFQCSGGGGGSSERVNEAGMTPEEKLAAREERAAKKEELAKLVTRYNAIYSLLETYGETLTDSTTPTQSVFKETLKTYTKKVNNSMKKETLEGKIDDIKVLYDKYKTQIEAAKLDEVKKQAVSANNSSYTTKVTGLNTALSNPTDTFGDFLKKDSSGAIEWNKDIDIMEFLSTWNSNETTKNCHIMRSIAQKHKSASGENKSRLETLTNKLHDKLLAEVGNIQESELSDETKKLLEDAKSQLEKFDTVSKRFPTSEVDTGKNYSDAFDNLYRAIRLARAEIAEKSLKESFEFLGEENPYKNSTIVTDTKNDLKGEFLETARAVTTPPQEWTPPSGSNEIKVDGTSYHVHTTNGTTTYYKADGTTMSEADFKNTVGEVEFKSDGSYKITKGDTISYYKADHTPSDEATYNAAAQSPDANVTVPELLKNNNYTEVTARCTIKPTGDDTLIANTEGKKLSDFTLKDLYDHNYMIEIKSYNDQVSCGWNHTNIQNTVKTNFNNICETIIASLASGGLDINLLNKAMETVKNKYIKDIIIKKDDSSENGRQGSLDYIGEKYTEDKYQTAILNIVDTDGVNSYFYTVRSRALIKDILDEYKKLA